MVVDGGNVCVCGGGGGGGEVEGMEGEEGDKHSTDLRMEMGPGVGSRGGVKEGGCGRKRFVCLAGTSQVLNS